MEICQSGGFKMKNKKNDKKPDKLKEAIAKTISELDELDQEFYSKRKFNPR